MVGWLRVRRAKQFAHLVDLAVDRPGAIIANMQASDEETARLVTLTHRLRETDLGIAPDLEFRDRLRRRLVAVATVNPPETTSVPAPREPAATPRVTRSVWRTPRVAFLGGAAAALVVVIGATLAVSGHSLPGDTLYSFKQAGEDFGLALARDSEQRGLQHLQRARTRLDEVSGLVLRTGLPTGLIGQTLDRMDADTVQGVQLLTTSAVQDGDDDKLARLQSWVLDQQRRLTSMTGPVGGRSVASLALLDRTRTRIDQLRASLRCACPRRTGADDLGPLPCGPCTTRSATTASAQPPAAPPAGRLPAAPAATHPPTATTPTGAPTSAPPSPSPTPGAALPTVPSRTPDIPPLLPPLFPTGGG